MHELRKIRGEVMTAIVVAAVALAVFSDHPAVVVGSLAAAIVVVLGVFLATRDRIGERSAAGTRSDDEAQRVAIGRARLQEIASQLGMMAAKHERLEPSPVDFRPLVSVVVPCFNDARFVAEALESLKRQTYERWECVVVDDASTDDSWEVIRDSVFGDERFRTLQLKSNSGSGAARNQGLEAATGEFVAFLDADDLLLSESLRDRVDGVGRHLDDALVAGSFCAVRSSAEEVTLDGLPARRHATQPDFIDFVSAKGECPFTLHAPLVAVDRVRSLGGFDESMTSGAVDWDLWYRMLRNGHVFVPSKTLGAIYRQKSGGITRSNKAGHTQASARLINAAYAPVDPAVMVAPTAFPMPEPLGSYQAKLVVADRAIRFAAMALAEGDTGDMHKTLDVLERGTWPLLDRHLDWAAVVGRGVARVVGLRPRDVADLADTLEPFVHTLRQTTMEVTA